MPDFDQDFNAQGLNCPLPTLRVKNVLKEMCGGQLRPVVATDPGSVTDFQGSAKQTGNELLESVKTNGEFMHLYINRRADTRLF